MSPMVKNHASKSKKGQISIFIRRRQIKHQNESRHVCFLKNKVSSRVTTKKKMKFEGRRLKFSTGGSVGRPNPKIEKKNSKNFTPTQNAKF